MNGSGRTSPGSPRGEDALATLHNVPALPRETTGLAFKETT
jgi:hypothetical protein